MRRVLLLFLVVTLAGCGGSADPRTPEADPTRLNVVFVLTDDMRTDDIAYMPNVLQMVRDGMYFSNYIVADSRCCPSRATILTGQLPHNTGVYTNSPPRGGLKAFIKGGAVDRTFAVTLRNLGYRTALFGKYINGYGAGSGGVPPGWTDWAASARAYQGFDYTLNVDGTPRQYGEQPEDYMTDVLAERGEDFLEESLVDTRPFFLKLSTFTPHLPAVAAPRHVGLVPKLKAPRTPAFNAEVSDAPGWLASRGKIQRTAIDEIDARYRNRIRSLVSVDEMVGRIKARVNELGMANNTVFVFSSDNGFHMGERRLLPGKMTAFDEDIRVPLIVTGPGVPAGSTVEALTQNTDLAPTFEQLAGASGSPGADGRSLVTLLKGEPVPADWRAGALIEHLGEAKAKAKDPDAQPKAAGNPPTYFALRTANGTYVEYRNGEREFYDRATDPDQLRNAYEALTIDEQRALSTALNALLTCDGAAQCATLTPPARRAAQAAAPGPRRAPRR
ncbi:MAG: sulfatase [Solirubrobacteraceae bacterium]